jgi:nicotinate-nucleotide adenylyltransferase
MSESEPRIALFGGTFDPIHKGHVAMATAAREALELDRVFLIPCAISPHKSDGPMPTNGESRMEMIRIACEGYPWMSVDACECERKGVSYSWQTAEVFRRRFPEARLFWILGEDQWLALPRWSHPERLASLVEFIVFGRDHCDAAPREGFQAWFLPAVHGASASEIRHALQSGAAPAGEHPWVDSSVLEYIRTCGLYQAGQ